MRAKSKLKPPSSHPPLLPSSSLRAQQGNGGCDLIRAALAAPTRPCCGQSSAHRVHPCRPQLPKPSHVNLIQGYLLCKRPSRKKLWSLGRGSRLSIAGTDKAVADKVSATETWKSSHCSC